MGISLSVGGRIQLLSAWALLLLIIPSQFQAIHSKLFSQVIFYCYYPEWGLYRPSSCCLDSFWWIGYSFLFFYHNSAFPPLLFFMLYIFALFYLIICNVPHVCVRNHGYISSCITSKENATAGLIKIRWVTQFHHGNKKFQPKTHEKLVWKHI